VLEGPNKTNKQKTNMMKNKQQELIFLENDDDEMTFSSTVESIQTKLQELHNCVAKLAPMVSQLTIFYKLLIMNY